MKKPLHFFATFFLCAAFGLSLTAQETLIRNGDFTGPRVEPGWVSIHEITNTTGAEFWHVQFNQALTPDQIDNLEVGETYELTFYAKASDDKELAVFFGEEGGSFHNLLDPDHEGVSIIDLTTEEQSFSFEFVAGTFDAMKLGFEGGLDNNGYSISNVEILLDEPPATVVDIIVSSHLHETLATAVVAADLVDALSGEGPFTVFAPTDDAFAALPDGVLDDLLDDPDGELTDILLYHVVAASALSTDLEDGQEITTMLDENVLVTINEEGVFINDAEVIVADLLAENGVVHVIDAVLLPPDDDTSISDLDAASFKVYPNPASDRLHVNTDKGAAITLINTMGSVVHSRTAESDKISLDVSSLPVGIYFISVENKGERVTQKVIVK